MPTEKRDGVAVSWSRGTKHRFYEDRYRILSRDVPLVARAKRGEIFAVFDGIGSAPRGMSAAQEMADCLPGFFREPCPWSASVEGLVDLLMTTNNTICDWGFMPGTDRPLGGCAGSIVWLVNDQMHFFHAGDTTLMLIHDGRGKEITHPHQTPDGAIFRYFGLGPVLKLDTGSIPIEESDRILLISDGITKVMDLVEIAACVEAHSAIDRAVDALTRQALARRATDDLTALLVQVEDIWETDSF